MGKSNYSIMLHVRCQYSGIWTVSQIEINCRLTWSSVFQFEVLIGKLSSIYGFSPCSISRRKIPPLNHKAGNDSMKCATLVVEKLPTLSNTLFTCIGKWGYVELLRQGLLRYIELKVTIFVGMGGPRKQEPDYGLQESCKFQREKPSCVLFTREIENCSYLSHIHVS